MMQLEEVNLSRENGDEKQRLSIPKNRSTTQIVKGTSLRSRNLMRSDGAQYNDQNKSTVFKTT